MEWIPAIYTAPRIQRIISPDKQVSNVGIYNSKTSDFTPEEALLELQGLDENIKEVYDIGTGRYSVIVSTGPGYETKRQEAVASIMALVQAYPNLMQIAGDLMIANMDWPYADEIAKRMKKQLAKTSPDLLESDGSPESKVVELQGQLEQIGQQHQLLVQALNQATQVIANKVLELDSKERIALINAQAGLAEAAIKGNLAGALSVMEATMGAIQSRLDLVHDHMTIEKEAAMEKQVLAAQPA